MKKLITSIGIATAGAFFVAQAFAQTTTPTPTTATTMTPTPTASVPQSAPSTGRGAY